MLSSILCGNATTFFPAATVACCVLFINCEFRMSYIEGFKTVSILHCLRVFNVKIVSLALYTPTFSILFRFPYLDIVDVSPHEHLINHKEKVSTAPVIGIIKQLYGSFPPNSSIANEGKNKQKLIQRNS